MQSAGTESKASSLQPLARDDEEEVTNVDEVARLPMLVMRATDREEKEKRHGKRI